MYNNAVRHTDPSGHCIPGWDCLGDPYGRYLSTSRKPYGSSAGSIVAGFSPSHDGQDIGGTFDVYAPADGRVVKARPDVYYGIWQFGYVVSKDTTGAEMRYTRGREEVWIKGVKTIASEVPLAQNKEIQEYLVLYQSIPCTNRQDFRTALQHQMRSQG